VGQVRHEKRRRRRRRRREKGGTCECLGRAKVKVKVKEREGGAVKHTWRPIGSSLEAIFHLLGRLSSGK